ncbi:hypothetical protein FN846DRAFT_372820 [Sphaerosporella brunnea]|uniref:Uncharacterized protein n=1 Tax=Sphaerosporella brunnea TaxID=1250544 RepID=A0A5J5EIP1_9PEZI|nr:hypothetical protein FN846DRAFT_372820 [Sphaerosporella brunnea]
MCFMRAGGGGWSCLVGRGLVLSAARVQAWLDATNHYGDHRQLTKHPQSLTNTLEAVREYPAPKSALVIVKFPFLVSRDSLRLFVSARGNSLRLAVMWCSNYDAHCRSRGAGFRIASCRNPEE